MQRITVLIGFFLAIFAATSAAQDRQPAAVELTAGYAGFVDDATIDHGVFGGAARFYVSRRLSVGPEIVYMIGPGADRDLYLTGNLTFDLIGPSAGRAPRLTPYLVAGGGFFRHTDRFGASTFSTTEGAVTGGGGIRAWVNDRVYVAGEARIGWEPHVRFTGVVGFALSPGGH